MIEREDTNDENFVPEIDERKNNSNNNNNNSRNSSKRKQITKKIRDHFQSKMGPCKNYSNCKYFSRNRRSRTADNLVKERRAAFYIREEDVQKYSTSKLSRFEVREVILQSRLDVIHNYIFHSDDEVMHVNESNSSKFVTKVGVDDDDDSKNNNNKQAEVKKMGQYSFGCWTNYWDKRHHFFVTAKYPDLKTELTSNAFHRLSLFSYEELEERARVILETRYGQSLKCWREFGWMKIDGTQLIKRAMQFEFKKNGFRKKNENERDSDIRRRNSEIAHWSRAIYETVYCWGTIMSRKRPLYHGISCKLLFSQFSSWFQLPTSLTTNVRVAQNFANDGIILVVKHAEQAEIDSLMFDVSSISDFPNEEERLIFRSAVQFHDIIMDNTSLKQWIKVLKFFEKLRNGRFLSHIQWSAEKQEKVVCMIENYIEDRKSSDLNNDEFYKNGNVPHYIQQCFTECANYRPTFNLNSHAINRSITNKKLLQFLDGSQKGKNSELLSIFTVRTAHIYEWKVTGDAYVKFFSEPHPWVIHPQDCTIDLAKEPSTEPVIFQFHWEIQNNKTDDILSCILRCDNLPESMKEVRMVLGIFVEETTSDMYSYCILDHRKMYAFVLDTVVESEKLLLKNNSRAKESEFNIKLSIFVCA